MTDRPDSTDARDRLIAITAWRHLLNRHDLAQVLDELAADPTIADPLGQAVERLTHTRTRTTNQPNEGLPSDQPTRP